MSSVRGGLILLAFGGALLLYYLRRRYLPRFKARFSNAQSGDSLHCLYIALAHVVAGAAPPALASWLIYAALNTAGLLPPFAGHTHERGSGEKGFGLVSPASCQSSFTFCAPPPS